MPLNPEVVTCEQRMSEMCGGKLEVSQSTEAVTSDRHWYAETSNWSVPREFTKRASRH